MADKAKNTGIIDLGGLQFAPIEADEPMKYVLNQAYEYAKAAHG